EEWNELLESRENEGEAQLVIRVVEDLLKSGFNPTFQQIFHHADHQLGLSFVLAAFQKLIPFFGVTGSGRVNVTQGRFSERLFVDTFEVSHLMTADRRIRDQFTTIEL